MSWEVCLAKVYYQRWLSWQSISCNFHSGSLVFLFFFFLSGSISQHFAPQWVPVNGHQALSGVCTRKPIKLTSKSTNWPCATFLCLLTSSFLFISSPLFILFLSRVQQLEAADKNPTNIFFIYLFLTFQQVSGQTRFRPCGPNKVWQDRVHVQSHVIMGVRCPRCSGGLGGRQPSRSHLRGNTAETKTLNLTALFYCKLVQPHLPNLTLSCEKTHNQQSCPVSYSRPCQWLVMLHADDRSWFCEERHMPSTPPILCQQSQLKPQHHRWNTNNTASCLSLDTPACSQKPLTHSAWP